MQQQNPTGSNIHQVLLFFLLKTAWTANAELQLDLQDPAV